MKSINIDDIQIITVFSVIGSGASAELLQNLLIWC